MSVPVILREQERAAAQRNRGFVGEVLPARSTDDEASKLLDELSRLQSWCVLMARHDPHAVQAADLVQRTRVLIIERCKR